MILLVEDTEDQRDFVLAILESHDLGPVAAVDSAEAAFRHLEVERTDGAPPEITVILMDIMLPGVDGIDATCIIKTNPRLADIPVIMTTSLEENDYLSSAFLAGALDYIMKPVKPTPLVARIRSAQRLLVEARRRREMAAELDRARATLETLSRSRGGLDPTSGRPDPTLFAALLATGRFRSLVLTELDHWGSLSAADPVAATALLNRIVDMAGRLDGAIGDMLVAAGPGRFALLFIGADPDAAGELANRLSRAVIAASLRSDVQGILPSATLTLAVAPAEASLATVEELLATARDAGGNRVVRLRSSDGHPS